MKTKLLIEYHSNNVRRPILSEAIKKSDVVLNILKASINGQMNGRIFAEVEGSSSEISAFMNYLSDNEVSTEIRQSLLEISKDRCNNCGECCEACPTGALTLENSRGGKVENSSLNEAKDEAIGKELQFDPYKCVSCDRCIAVCPVEAIREV